MNIALSPPIQIASTPSRPDLSQRQDVAARFFREARAASLIEHPSIVSIFEYGSDGQER